MRWWQFGPIGDRGCVQAIGETKSEDALCRIYKSVSGFGMVDRPNISCLNNVGVFASDRDEFLFVLFKSRPHELWARFFASSMKDDLRYTLGLF